MVVRTALQEAASIAGLMITTEAGVADSPRRDSHASHDHDHGGGMGGIVM
jgi:chaperonin GroEL